MILSNVPTGIIYSDNPVIPPFGLSVGGFISFVLGSPIIVQILALPSHFFIQEKNKESKEQKEKHTPVDTLRAIPHKLIFFGEQVLTT